MKKLVVDQDKCLGCGTCVAICPEVFELREEGKAQIKLKAQGSTHSTGSGLMLSKVEASRLKAQIQGAIDSCPVGAIGWE